MEFEKLETAPVYIVAEIGVAKNVPAAVQEQREITTTDAFGIGIVALLTSALLLV
jgi:hypothetical protein